MIVLQNTQKQSDSFNNCNHLSRGGKGGLKEQRSREADADIACTRRLVHASCSVTKFGVFGP